jgi:hypothetical protein
MAFLVIGGHAANAYGISRQTGDLDLLVKLSQKNEWSILLVNKLRYTPMQDDEKFTRYKPSEIAAWPIDLMYVDDITFSKMYADGKQSDFGHVTVPVVSIRHLIILKIHALKYFQAHRYSKDFTDIVGLMKSSKDLFTSYELQELCKKYASTELFDKLARELEL